MVVEISRWGKVGISFVVGSSAVDRNGTYIIISFSLFYQQFNWIECLVSISSWTRFSSSVLSPCSFAQEVLAAEESGDEIFGAAVREEISLLIACLLHTVAGILSSRGIDNFIYAYIDALLTDWNRKKAAEAVHRREKSRCVITVIIRCGTVHFWPQMSTGAVKNEIIFFPAEDFLNALGWKMFAIQHGGILVASSAKCSIKCTTC